MYKYISYYINKDSLVETVSSRLSRKKGLD